MILLALLAARACALNGLAEPEASKPPVALPLAQVEALATPPRGAWRHSVALYMFAAGLDGSATVEGVDADVDLSFSDIWSNLRAGAMFGYRAQSDEYALSVDVVYMGLEAEKSSSLVDTRAQFDELVVTIDGSLRVSERTEVLLGARYWGLEGDLRLRGPGPGVDAKQSVDWVDPLIGVRYVWPFAEDWSLTLRGDIGGFGVGSDFSWHAMARVGWFLSRSTELSLGVRLVDVDYSEGSGGDEFRYDVLTAGVLGGVIFSF